MTNNDALKKWEDTVQDQAQRDSNLFQQSHNEVYGTVRQNRREIEEHDQTQENNANDYHTDDIYTDR